MNEVLNKKRANTSLCGGAMRIAQVSPLYESVPPLLYGGTERIISFLTEELVDRSHHVTLFASGDSQTRATLQAPLDQSLRLHAYPLDASFYHVQMFQQLIAQQDEFDLIHFHTDYSHLGMVSQLRVPYLTTWHGRTDLIDLKNFFALKRNQTIQNFISISHQQKNFLPQLNWIGTIYHGLPERLLTPYASDAEEKNRKGQYLAFLGRISPEKGLDQAIQLALMHRLPLKIAAKIEHHDSDYFQQKIRPYLSDPLIEYIGEINEQQKRDFLGKALALIFPIRWPEPFGLVMIEALACGTPVIAYRSGSVPEIIEHQKTGFVVNDLQEASQALDHIGTIDRHNCRLEFERRFSVKKMVDGYMKIYHQLVQR